MENCLLLIQIFTVYRSLIDVSKYLSLIQLLGAKLNEMLQLGVTFCELKNWGYGWLLSHCVMKKILAENRLKSRIDSKIPPKVVETDRRVLQTCKFRSMFLFQKCCVCKLENMVCIGTFHQVKQYTMHKLHLFKLNFNELTFSNTCT